MSLAFIFPGQGSQSVGMLNDLAAHFPVVGETFAEASEVLAYDLWQVVARGPEDRLNATEVTQPAMLAAGVSVWRVWQQQRGAAPRFMAGHSLGEYTALVCADALPFRAALQLVSARGRLMQEAVPPGTGAMAAIIGLDDAQVERACAEIRDGGGGVVEAVNFNSPGQVVIAGNRAAVLAATERAKALGAKRAVELPVSVPSHCSLMAPAAAALSAELAAIEIRAPRIPVVHNVDATPHAEPERIREVLAAQLSSPVRWVESVRRMASSGVRSLVECGPGKVLSNLAKRIDRSLTVVPLFDADSVHKGLALDLAA